MKRSKQRTHFTGRGYRKWAHKLMRERRRGIRVFLYDFKDICTDYWPVYSAHRTNFDAPEYDVWGWRWQTEAEIRNERFEKYMKRMKRMETKA